MLYLISLNPLLLKNIAYVGNLLFLPLSLGYLGFSIFTVRPSLSDNSYIGCWLEKIFSQFWQISWKGGKGRKCPGSSAATQPVNRRPLLLLRTLHCTLFIFHFTLCSNLHSVHSLHSTLCNTLHCTLYSLRHSAALYTLQHSYLFHINWFSNILTHPCSALLLAVSINI